MYSIHFPCHDDDYERFVRFQDGRCVQIGHDQKLVSLIRILFYYIYTSVFTRDCTGELPAPCGFSRNQ